MLRDQKMVILLLKFTSYKGSFWNILHYDPPLIPKSPCTCGILEVNAHLSHQKLSLKFLFWSSQFPGSPFPRSFPNRLFLQSGAGAAPQFSFVIFPQAFHFSAFSSFLTLPEISRYGEKVEDMILCNYYKIEVVLAMFPYRVGLGEAPWRFWKTGQGVESINIVYDFLAICQMFQTSSLSQ